MRTKFVSALGALIFMVGLFALTPSAYAMPKHQAMPLVTQDCSAGCSGTNDWNGGNNDGGLATFFVPSYTGSSTNVLVRSIRFFDSLRDQIEVGECYGSPTSGEYSEANVCGNSGKYFVIEWTVGTDRGDVVQGNIPSGDKGHTVQFGVQPDANFTTNGLFDAIINDESGVTGGTTCGFTTSICQLPYGFGTDEQFSNLVVRNYIKDTWTGTLQGSSNVIFNQYYSTTLSNGFIDQPGNGTQSPVNGAGLKWTDNANGETNEGGTFAICNVAGSSTC